MEEKNPHNLIVGKWYAIHFEDCCVDGDANMRYRGYVADSPDDVYGVYTFDGGEGSPATFAIHGYALGFDVESLPTELQ